MVGIMIINFDVSKHTHYGWLLAAALLIPLTLGLACSSVSSASPEDQAELDAVNTAMTYIRAHHTDAAAYIPASITFTRTAIPDKQKIGFARNAYSGSGWTVSVGSPVTAEVIYEISAVYSGGKITWTGNIKEGIVSELSYNRKDA